MNKKILVVDDEEEICGIVVSQLKESGFEVYLAHDGLEALEVLKDHSSMDYILSDVKMPLMDGIEFLNTIKENQYSYRHFIFMTGFSDISSREAIRLGASKVVMKPVMLDELIDIINDLS